MLMRPLQPQTLDNPWLIYQQLPPQQILMPQENPFDILSDLIPHQEKEVEPIFKTPVLDDFLLPPVLGDQITDTTFNAQIFT